jgi:hypothetical protein
MDGNIEVRNEVHIFESPCILYVELYLVSKLSPKGQFKVKICVYSRHICPELNTCCWKTCKMNVCNMLQCNTIQGIDEMKTSNHNMFVHAIFIPK